MAIAGKIRLIIVLVCCFQSAYAQNDSIFAAERLSSFNLYNARLSERIKLPAPDANRPYSLFIFLSPECPLSQNYLPLLNTLRETYSNDISFYGIIPGKTYPAKMIRDFAATYKIQFPLLIDSTKALTNYLGARVTPEIIFLDNGNRLVYKGAIDDLLTGLGKRRIKAANEYLKNAIVQTLENVPVTVKRTKAVGCKINDY
jgi:hypothetical protein